MKTFRSLNARFRPQSGILAIFLGLLAFALPAPAAVIYSGEQNLSVAQSLEGLYLNVVTGSTATLQPGDWATAPWINPFFGGVSIGSSDLLRPKITGGSQILQLAVGTVIDSSGTYAAAESGSATHIGPGGDQFQFGASQMLGFVMQTGTGSPLYYGWLRLIIDNSGAGTLQDWAYDNTPGTAIPAGLSGTTFVIPEPSRALLLLLSLHSLLLRRRRS